MKVCTYPQGRNEKFCKHLCLGIIFSNSPVLSPSDRKKLAYLASRKIVNKDFIAGMDTGAMLSNNSLEISHIDYTNNRIISNETENPHQDIIQEEININLHKNSR